MQPADLDKTGDSGKVGTGPLTSIADLAAGTAALGGDSTVGQLGEGTVDRPGEGIAGRQEEGIVGQPREGTVGPMVDMAADVWEGSPAGLQAGNFAGAWVGSFVDWWEGSFGSAHRTSGWLLAWPCTASTNSTWFDPESDQETSFWKAWRRCSGLV